MKDNNRTPDDLLPEDIDDAEATDQADQAMLQLAHRQPDALVALEALARDVEGYSGKILIRLPRSLHKKLTAAAQIEGVSLNQYILYKLSSR